MTWRFRKGLLDVFCVVETFYLFIEVPCFCVCMGFAWYGEGGSCKNICTPPGSAQWMLTSASQLKSYLSDRIYSVSDNYQGTKVAWKEACSHADDGDI